MTARVPVQKYGPPLDTPPRWRIWRYTPGRWKVRASNHWGTVDYSTWDEAVRYAVRRIGRHAIQTALDQAEAHPGEPQTIPTRVIIPARGATRSESIEHAARVRAITVSLRAEGDTIHCTATRREI